MFEGSLVESRGLVVSGAQRWTALGSLTFQLAVAGLLLAIPLVRPQILPPFMVAPHVELPLPVKPPVPVVPMRAAGSSATVMGVPSAGPRMEPTRRFTFGFRAIRRMKVRRHSTRRCHSEWEGQGLGCQG